MGDFDDIKSRTYTPEYGEGHERTFGAAPSEPRQAKRTRYVYRNGRLVEQFGPEDTGPEVVEEDMARNHVMSDLYMVGVSATDREGKTVDIGSRAKRRAFMRANDFSDVDDWKGEWDAAAKRREKVKRGEVRDPALREALGRAAYEASKRR